MRVTIKREDCQALCRRPPVYSLWTRVKDAFTDDRYEPATAVRAEIILSEEERAIIAHNRLWDRPLYVWKATGVDLYHLNEEMMSRWHRGGEGIIFTVREVAEGRPFEIIFRNPIEAANFAHELETDILPRLAQNLKGLAEAPKSKKFEL